MSQTSVKNISDLGDELLFEFTDRYSVFDWGPMPQEIKNKGVSLASMAKSFFKYFEQLESWRILKNYEHKFKGLESLKTFKDLCCTGIQHHYRKEKGSRGIIVKKFSVIGPSFKEGNWDYREYETRPIDTIVPLEVIFRFGMGKGSSLKLRIKDIDYLKSLGLKNPPVEGEFFKWPVIEFSSKYESLDRYFDYRQAKKNAGLSEVEFFHLKELSQLLAINLHFLVNQLHPDLNLFDGKFEWAFVKGEDNSRSFVLVDSLGLDELRLVYKGASLSKEFLREYYRKTSWFKAVEDAKKIRERKNLKDWKSLCHESPENLPKNIIDGASLLYQNFEKAFQLVTSGKWGQDNSSELKDFLESFINNYSSG